MPNMYKDGYYFWPDDEKLLVELIIVDEEKRGEWFHPDEMIVRKACEDFNIEPDRILELIGGKENRTYHTLFINAPVYRGDKE